MNNFVGKEVNTPYGQGICVEHGDEFRVVVYLFNEYSQFHNGNARRSFSKFTWPDDCRTFYCVPQEVSLVSEKERKYKFELGEKVETEYGQGTVVGIDICPTCAPYLISLGEKFNGHCGGGFVDTTIRYKALKSHCLWMREDELRKVETTLKYKIGDPVICLGKIKGFIAGIDHEQNEKYPYLVYCENTIPLDRVLKTLSTLKNIIKQYDKDWEIGYGPSDAKYTWFKTNEVAPMKKEKYPNITIEHIDKYVIATMKENGRLYLGTAACAPEDVFNYAVGAKLAVERLMKQYEKNYMEN